MQACMKIHIKYRLLMNIIFKYKKVFYSIHKENMQKINIFFYYFVVVIDFAFRFYLCTV